MGWTVDDESTPLERFAELVANQFDSNLDYAGAEVKRRILITAHLLTPDHPQSVGLCAVCVDDDRVDDRPAQAQEAWRDRHGDVWTLGADGLMHTPDTAPFSREHVEKKWGPLVPIGVNP